jgi:hypothetical protein
LFEKACKNVFDLEAFVVLNELRLKLNQLEVLRLSAGVAHEQMTVEELIDNAQGIYDFMLEDPSPRYTVLDALLPPPSYNPLYAQIFREWYREEMKMSEDEVDEEDERPRKRARPTLP